MKTNTTRAPLTLTAAMQTNRVEEVNALRERAELDLARIRAEGRALAERRAAAQAANRRLDRLAFASVILILVGFWSTVFTLGGWRAVSASLSIALIASVVLFLARSIASQWGRIIAALSGRP